MIAFDLAPYIDAARSHLPVRHGRRRRVVLRWHAADIARFDALRERYKVSRATVVRALVYLALVVVEQLPAPPPPPPPVEEGGAR